MKRQETGTVILDAASIISFVGLPPSAARGKSGSAANGNFWFMLDCGSGRADAEGFGLMLWCVRSVRFVGVEWALLVRLLLAGDGRPCGVRCDPIGNRLEAAFKFSSLAAANINSLVLSHSRVVAAEETFAS